MKYILVKGTNFRRLYVIMILIIIIIIVYPKIKEKFVTTSIKEDQHKMETKLPVLINHKYAYDDYTPNKCLYYYKQPITNKARLKELPLNLKNIYHEKIGVYY